MNSPKRDVFFYYVYSVFSNMDFARGIFVLFLLHKGMTAAQVGVLQTVLFWSNLTAEIPAGVLADKFKRKYSVAFGLLCIAIAAAGYVFFSSFVPFLIIFLIHGIGFAFQSGADTALLYDNLKSRGEKWSSKFLSISAKSRNVGTLAMAFAILAGGYLSEIHWNWVYISFGAAMLFALMAILSISEGVVHTQEASEMADESPKEPLIPSIKRFLVDKKGKQVLLFIFGMAFIEAMHAPFFIYIQILFKDYGMDTDAIGIVIAASLIFTSFSYLLIDRFPKWKLKNILKWTSLSVSALTAVLLMKPELFLVIPIYFIVETIPSLVFVYTDNHINESIPSEIRASLLSVQSFLSSLFISFAFLGCGFLLETTPSHLVLGSLFILPLLATFFLMFYFRKNEV